MASGDTSLSKSLVWVWSTGLDRSSINLEIIQLTIDAMFFQNAIFIECMLPI